MAENIDYYLFGVYPYIALSVLVLGSIVRYEREPYTWRSGSSQLLRRRQLIWGSVLFHVGVLIVFFGHLIGLLTPISVFAWLGISHTFKQLLAMIVGGVAGAFALVGAFMLLHRRLFDARIRTTSGPGDILILALLCVQLILGLATIPLSAQHLDGSEMVKFMAWAQGIFALRPGVWRVVEDTGFIFKTHLFLGTTILFLVPFTRMVHILSAPVRYVWRPGYQIVRSKKAAKAAL